METSFYYVGSGLIGGLVLGLIAYSGIMEGVEPPQEDRIGTLQPR